MIARLALSRPEPACLGERHLHRENQFLAQNLAGMPFAHLRPIPLEHYENKRNFLPRRQLYHTLPSGSAPCKGPQQARPPPTRSE